MSSAGLTPSVNGAVGGRATRQWFSYLSLSCAGTFSTPPRQGATAPSTAGFTLLLASLVASLVIILGIAIFTIIQKEITLSSIGRDSQFAFYAADTGAECALYWDRRHDSFSTSTPETDPVCDGQLLNPEGYSDTLPYTITFEYEPFAPDGNCVQVTVIKQATQPRTRIRADGFSTSCDTITTSPRTLQRSVEFTY